MNLLKITENEYVWTSVVYGPKYLNSLKDTLKYGNKHLGIAIREMELGLLDCINKEHNYVEFGDAQRSYMYTKTIDINPRVIEELRNFNKGDK